MNPYTISLVVDRTRSEKQNGRSVVVERWQARCEVEIRVSDAGIRFVAERACLNKTGHSKSGPVSARVLKFTRLP